MDKLDYAQLHASARILVDAWAKAAEEQRRWAHSPDSGPREQSRAVFAGRSDAYQNCADTLQCILGLFELGMRVSEIGIGSAPLPEEAE